MKTNAISQVTRDAIIAEYLAGAGSDTVGKKYNIHPNTVLKMVKAAGHSSRGVLKRAIPSTEYSNIHDLYVNKGVTQEEIGKRYGVTHGVISKLLKEMGVDQRDAIEAYTQDSWVEEATKVHNGYYGYEAAIYKGSKELIEVTCPDHGNYLVEANSHLKGTDCRKCLSKTEDEVLELIKKFHENKYTYIDFKYNFNTKAKIKVICKDHGEFITNIWNHAFLGSGCYECGQIKSGISRSYTQEEYVEICKKVHDGFYTYDKTVYTGILKKIIVTCPVHGDFECWANHHLNGSNCKFCNQNNVSIAELSWLEFEKVPNDKEHRQVEIKLDGVQYFVDGYMPETKTVYEFHGTFWHSHPDHFKAEDKHPVKDGTHGDVYAKTLAREEHLRKHGYNVVVMWGHEWKEKLKQQKDIIK